MRQTESLKATQRVAFVQRHLLRQVITQRHRHFVIVALPLNRHRDHLQHRFKQTDRHSAVTLPQVHYRNTASVIRVVHTEVVLLRKAFRHRQNPIQTRR